MAIGSLLLAKAATPGEHETRHLELPSRFLDSTRCLEILATAHGQETSERAAIYSSILVSWLQIWPHAHCAHRLVCSRAWGDFARYSYGA